MTWKSPKKGRIYRQVSSDAGFSQFMKIDRVHFYVEDARASCNWFVGYLGFQRVGGHYSSFHTRTEVVQSGSVCFWLSSPLSTLSPVAEFLRQHPPGVADVAFEVEDIAAVMARAQAHDVTILQPIQEYQENGEYVKSGKIAAWGGLTHTLIERSGGVGEWGSGENLVIYLYFFLLSLSLSLPPFPLP